MSWPGKKELARRIVALLRSAKASGCESRPCRHDAPVLGSEGAEFLDHWAGEGEVLFVHDHEEQRLYRVPLAYGQSEEFHIDVRDEIATREKGTPKAVVLFTEPRTGPMPGQTHFGLVAWKDERGAYEDPIAVFDA